MDLVVLEKVKRPAGPFRFIVSNVDDDEHGSWLFGGLGSPWTAPLDDGVLDFPFVVLIPPREWWVAWWVDYPSGPQVEVDICLPASRTQDGWSFVDLELDVYRRQDQTVEIMDRDEFDLACRHGWIPAGEAARATESAGGMVEALELHTPPFDDSGWERLRAATS